jgi:hypothetical protein
MRLDDALVADRVAELRHDEERVELLIKGSGALRPLLASPAAVAAPLPARR